MRTGAIDTTARAPARGLIAACYMAGFVAGLDATSAFFVFPEVRDQLAGGDAAAASWILTIVGIVGGAALLQAGRIADRHGHNRLLVASAAGASIAALAGAVAPTLALLVAAKGMQAGCLAGLGVSSIAILVRESPSHQLAGTLSRWGFWTATSGVAGPIVAAVLVEWTTWRLVFVVGAAAAIVVAVLAWPSFDDAFEQAEREPVDWIATIASLVGLSLVVLVLLEGNSWGWSSPRTVAVGAAGIAGVATVLIRSHGAVDPVVPLGLYRHRNYSLATVIILASQIGFYAMWLALLSYAVDVAGKGLAATGVVLTLMPGTMVLTVRTSGRLADAHGERVVMAVGGAVMAAGFAITATVSGSEPSYWPLLPAIIGGGIGMAAMVSNATSAGTATVAADVLGTGTALLQTMGRVGGAIGSALVVVLIEAGVRGDPATHHRPLWMIAGCALLAALMSLGLRTAPTGTEGVSPPSA